MLRSRGLDTRKHLTLVVAAAAWACGTADVASSEKHAGSAPPTTVPADSGIALDSGAVDDNEPAPPEPNGVGELGTPSDAGDLPEGTPCEEFSHVQHLPWDERPSACPTGDWCMKKDDGPYEGASTWYGHPGASRFMTITCKIGNRCLRFVGMNNCHYDLYDPDTNVTIEPADSVAWARKDGHSYSNFRVRLPGSDTIYNFMSRTVEARDDPREAMYCPSDVYSPEGVEPVDFDPNQGDQTKGCGAEGSLLYMFGDDRGPIPYDTNERNAYDWTYQQDGEE